MTKRLIFLFVASFGIAAVNGWSFLQQLLSNRAYLQNTSKDRLQRAINNHMMTNSIQKCGLLVFNFIAPVLAAEVELPKSMNGPVDSPYSFQYTEDLISAPKLVKTHQIEVFLKSEQVKGFNVGLTVDPVKINSIKEFTTAPNLAERVLTVEKGKDGFIDGSVITTAETTVSTNGGRSIPVYDLDYQVETTRGLNHFRVRTAIAGKKLYVFTAQCKQDSYQTLAPVMQEILASFKLQS